MSNIVFDDEMGRIQREIAESHDLVVRRKIFMEALNLRTGERVLELGCGGGSYAFEAAQFVGPTGHVSAIDISADQIAAAREHCGRFAWVEFQIGNDQLVDIFTKRPPSRSTRCIWRNAPPRSSTYSAPKAKSRKWQRRLALPATRQLRRRRQEVRQCSKRSALCR